MDLLEEFMQVDINALKEKQVSESMIPLIEGKVADVPRT
jgi:hypothetical protein